MKLRNKENSLGDKRNEKGYCYCLFISMGGYVLVSSFVVIFLV